MLFHAFIVVLALVSTGGSGEGQAYIVLFFDLPLVLLLRIMPGGGYILYNSTIAYVGFFSIVGTLMYGVVGYGIGVLISKLQKKLSTTKSGDY